MSLADECKRRPFSNGTEEQAWMAVWCQDCTHDHGMTHHNSCGDGCPLLLDYMVNIGDDFHWPEAWLPAPPETNYLPSRMVCGMFQPCVQGDCDGDPEPELRAEIVAEVTSYWAARSGSTVRAERDGSA